MNKSTLTFFVTLVTILFGALPAKAQDLIVKNDGTSITAYNIEITENSVFYQLENKEDAAINRLKVSDILIIRKVDGTKIDPNSTVVEKIDSVVTAKVVDTLDLANYHGYLMAKGNNIFITSNSGTDYEEAGVEALKKGIKARGFWNVVDNIEEAHFVLQYGVCLSGQDRAFVYLRTPESYKKIPTCVYDIWLYRVQEPSTIISCVYTSSEDKNRNIEVAKHYLGSLYFTTFEIEDDDPILESLKNGNLPKHANFSYKKKTPGYLPTSVCFRSIEEFWNAWLDFYRK